MTETFVPRAAGDAIKAAPRRFVLEALGEADATRRPADWRDRLDAARDDGVRREIAAKPGFSVKRLTTLVSPAASAHIEEMAARAVALTRRRFGNAISLFAPLYLSNYCVNRCRYCGFNAGRRHRRRRLSLDEAFAEAKILAGGGFREILLVSGEDRAAIDTEYLCALARRLRAGNLFSSVSVEIHVESEENYRRLFEAGIDGVTIFQETYDRDEYALWHAGGPKTVYENRLIGQENAARAGMRRLGLGALLGLTDWRFEALALGVHASTLLKRYWRSKVSFSFPRIRPAEGGEGVLFRHIVADRDFVQMLAALRLCFPDAGMTLSTRESPALRDRLIPLGFTQISAGSRVNPGGYNENDGEPSSTGQFSVSDERGPAEMTAVLRRLGFDPVWKDWDAGFGGGA
ncbi:MAG: 2-iminoacetate synthase ThiH [Planctomycetota bacterium]|jgi:2-iminoacetate synthase|nr:2-iminoacetate synthase ThiH [Planctomycetota bacterium]